MGDALQLGVLEEVRTAEPPIRISALFFEPGGGRSGGRRAPCPRRRGGGRRGAPVSCPPTGSARAAVRRGPGPAGRVPPAALAGGPAAGRPARRHGRLPPEGEDGGGRAPWRRAPTTRAPLFETNPDGVFCALQGRRLPSRRHPLGMQLRIEELTGDHVTDDGGELWWRRIEELEAAACALCAHRYAVGHASWLGDPAQAVLVLPGSSLPREFASQGVLPPVERLQLPPVTRRLDWKRWTEAATAGTARLATARGSATPGPGSGPS